ncbi:MAG: C2 family cysteine protease [Cyanobacteriota/Melainabacteria group bacterium]
MGDNKPARIEESGDGKAAKKSLDDHFDVFGDAIMPQKGFTPTDKFRAKNEQKAESFVKEGQGSDKLAPFYIDGRDSDKPESKPEAKPETRPNNGRLSPGEFNRRWNNYDNYPNYYGKPGTWDNYSPGGFLNRGKGNGKESRFKLPELKTAVPQNLTMPEFRDLALERFKDIDTNDNGVISVSELARAVEDGDFKGQDAQMLAGLYNSREKIYKNSYDLPFPWTDQGGITMKDISLVGDEIIPKGFAGLSDVEKNFDQIDKNKDGYMSRRELEKAGIDGATLQYIEKEYDEIQGTKLDGFWSGISRADIAEYREDQKKAYEEADEALVWGGLVNTHNTQLRLESFGIDEDTKFNFDFTYDRIQQSDAGSCYLISVLASAARNSPDTLENLIKDNENGTYTVTFPGDRENPVTVKAPTEAELGLFRHSRTPNRNQMWVPIMEKAYGEWRLEHGDMRERRLSEKEKLAYDAAGQGGYIDTVTRLVTGVEPEVTKLKRSSGPALEARFEKAFASGNQLNMTITTQATDSGQTPSGYFGKHAYSILDYDGERDGGASILLRNPWGEGTNSPRGEFWVKVDDLYKDFNFVVVAELPNSKRTPA